MTTRAFALGKQHEKADNGDLFVDMAFASTEPYQRWWGIEVLDVSDKAVRMGRLNDGAPLLFNHNWDDLRGTHMPGSVKADKDGVLRGRVRITSATQAGRDTIGLVESGVLSKASVGYQIHKVIEQSTKKSGERIEREIDGATFERLLKANAQTRDGRMVGGDANAFRRGLDEAVGQFDRAEDDVPVYRVVDWEPLENSLVTVPADNTVGVGRSAEPVSQPAAPSALPIVPQLPEQTMKHRHLLREQATDGATGSTGGGAAVETRASVPAQPAQAPQHNAERAVEIERERRRGIENLCKANKIDEAVRDYWIGAGLSMSQVSDDLLKILKERGETNPQSEAKIGMTDGDVRRYSLFNAIRAVVDKSWNKAGFELECSRAIADKLGRVSDPHKFFVPFEVQQRQVTVPQRRDLTVGTASAGGYLVGTQNMSFIEILRNRSVAYRMGARRLSGLVGNVTVPRQSAAATAVWLDTEAATITESAQTFGQLSLSPKSVGAYTEISRQLLLQSSPDAEGIVTADLGAVASIAMDKGVLEGSGASGQPTGISATSGIGSVTGTSIDYAKVLEFQTDVAAANVMPVAGGYVTTPAVAALLMQRARFSNTDTPLWGGNIWDGTMVGFPAMSSNQLTAASMMFGDWSQVIVAEWGVLEVEVNPYAGFQAGIIGVRAILSMDVGLRYAAAFSRATSIT